MPPKTAEGRPGPLLVAWSEAGRITCASSLVIFLPSLLVHLCGTGVALRDYDYFASLLLKPCTAKFINLSINQLISQRYFHTYCNVPQTAGKDMLCELFSGFMRLLHLFDTAPR